MLSTHHNEQRRRKVRNLIPNRLGVLRTRPGARQVIAGAIEDAAGWGNRVVASKAGRIVLWDGSNEIDIRPAGARVQAAPFQALTANAQREDRLYIADATRPLWYIARRGGAWVSEDVVNEVKDASGAPYDIPIPIAIEVWRSRLWIAFGTNRAQHCQNDNPSHWDPIWTIECQGAQADKIDALRAHGTTLVAGLATSIWAIEGTSQFNFSRDPLIEGTGCAGPNSLASDGQLFVGVSRAGVHTLARPAPLSEDIEEYFAGGLYPAHCVFDTRRRWVLVAAGGRLFVMHMDKAGLWGEVAGANVIGLLQLRDHTGWYGRDGVWLFTGEDMDDQWLDGSRTVVRSEWETWEETPNLTGSGRAVLTRNIFALRGSSRGKATFTARAQDTNRQPKTFVAKATLSDSPQELWSDRIAGLQGEASPPPPVRREFVPQLAGRTFVRSLTAECHIEIVADGPVYRYPRAKS